MTKLDDPSYRPRLSAGFRLQFEAVQQGWVLLYPEGMVQLNDSAGAILGHCSGRLNVAEIVSQLETDFDTTELAPEVNDFLLHAAAQGWIRPT